MEVFIEQTANYQLSQWDAEDRILREDFNADNAKIDAALAAQAEAQSALASQIANCGNCKVTYSTYTGTGTCGSSSPNKLSFDTKPFMIFIIDADGTCVIMHCNSTFTRKDGSPIYITWSGNTVSWYNSGSDDIQCNNPEEVYHVFTLSSV